MTDSVSSRQLIVEALATKNAQLKRELLLSNKENSTISKLMPLIYTDSTDFYKIPSLSQKIQIEFNSFTNPLVTTSQATECHCI